MFTTQVFDDPDIGSVIVLTDRAGGKIIVNPSLREDALIAFGFANPQGVIVGREFDGDELQAIINALEAAVAERICPEHGRPYTPVTASRAPRASRAANPVQDVIDAANSDMTDDEFVAEMLNLLANGGSADGG